MDTAPAPTHVAILGAGPVGMDAALACAANGWAFTVFEAATQVGANVRAWSHVRLFTPWSMNVSARMRAALRDAAVDVPDGAHEYPTGAEFTARLLEPLAALPTVNGRLRFGTDVRAISRQGLVKDDEIGTGRRAQRPFRLLVTEPGGAESVHTADLVIDASGGSARPNMLGDGGIPAPGETDPDLGQYLTRTIPNLETQRDSYAGRRTLLVGAGKSAQTTARALAELAETHPGTELVWAVRAEHPDWGEIPGDQLPQRQALVDISRGLAAGDNPAIAVRTGVVVDTLLAGPGGVTVALRDADDATEQLTVDRVVALTGSVGDTGLYSQLQVHECYATAGPMNLSASLLAAAAEGAVDCLDQPPAGVDTLRVPEPNFFVLGMKSYGRHNTFLLRTGYEQVDEVAGAYAAAA